MKRIIAFLMSFVILAMLVLVSVSASDSRKIDMRELEEYGQLHFYLGEPVAKEKLPNVSDATVNDGEYVLSYEYKKGDKHAVLSDQPKTSTLIDNEWVRFYLSYDEENLYAAIETKDPNYIKGKDGMAFNLGFRDSGRPLDAITRFCFDLYAHEDAEDGDITSLKTKCRYFIKKDNGEWDNPPASDAMMYVSGASICHDDKSDITTIEVAFDLYFLAKELGNELDLKDIRMYFFPFVYMYGESVSGKGDVASQGILWCYLKSDYIANLKPQFVNDYPDSTYWSSIVPNIVHFCADPATTTIPDITAPQSTTAVLPVTDTVTTQGSEGTESQTTATSDSKGCTGSVTLSAVAIIPMLLIGFVNVKKEDQ